MKQLVLMLAIFSLVSCEKMKQNQLANDLREKKEYQQKIKFIEGRHPLRRFRVFDQVTGTSYSSFFLIGGSTQTSVDSERKIGFYWLSNEKEYIYTTVNMTDVRVVIDSTAHIPFIEFQWRESGYDDVTSSVQYNIDYYLKYVLIHAKENDFPQDVSLGELK